MTITLRMPKLSPTMEMGQIAQWHKKENDKVNEGDILFSVVTDKATIDYPSPEEGYLRKILVKENQSASLGDPVALLTKTLDEPIAEPVVAKPPSPKKEEKKEKSKKTEEKNKEPFSMHGPSFVPESPLEKVTFEEHGWEFHKRALSSPLARKLAKENGLDLASVQGSGPDGRIMSCDLSHARKKACISFGEKAEPEIPSGTFLEEKLSPMRQVIGKRLQESKTFIPHFYVTQEIEVSLLVEMRKELKSAGIDLTVNDFMIKAAALALRENPHVNSGFHSEHETIIRFQTIDIAVAVSMPNGLITPIIRYADYKNLGQISQESKILSQKAKEGKLLPQEYKGGSFTISNLGMYGTSSFSAIINPPQAAILAIGSIVDKPVVKGDKVLPGKTLTVMLSADHRVVDGADGALFLRSFKKFLENPTLLLLG